MAKPGRLTEVPDFSHRYQVQYDEGFDNILVVDGVPARGAVAVWPRLAPPFGHVAYVTRVAGSGSIGVAEYNFPYLGDETYVFGTRDDVSTRGAVFIHVPRRSSRSRHAAPLR